MVDSPRGDLHMALTTPTIGGGLTNVAQSFNTNAAHSGHKMICLGSVQNSALDTAQVFYCQDDNKVLVQNG